MEIKELNKTQLILLSLLITFVVSIATGIVTVSLMDQAPESVPQTVNNVIQRTIEKVTTVQVPVTETSGNTSQASSAASLLGDGDAMVSVYSYKDVSNASSVNDSQSISGEENVTQNESVSNLLGQGVIISEIGLVLVDSSILNGYSKFKVVLAESEFEASILKQFSNGFSVLKILNKVEDKTANDNTEEGSDSSVDTN